MQLAVLKDIYRYTHCSLPWLGAVSIQIGLNSEY